MSKIIFFGLGSIGKRHVKILQNNYNHELIAFRSDKNNYKSIADLKSITSWDEFERINPDIAFITNPTYKHMTFLLLLDLIYHQILQLFLKSYLKLL